MLLAFTTRRMVRSPHLAFSLTRFTDRFDFAVSYRYSHEKIHTESLVRRNGLISAQVTTHQARAFRQGPDLVTSDIPNDAVCIYSPHIHDILNNVGSISMMYTTQIRTIKSKTLL